jgi:cell division septal protein FtsQ
VEYTQSAKNDLAAQTPTNDPRMRYTRFRADKTIRVLGDPRESSRADRHQTGGLSGGLSDDTGPLPGGRRGGGTGGAGGAGGTRGAAGVGAAQRDRRGGMGQQPKRGASLARSAKGTTVREHRRRQRSVARRTSRLPSRVLLAAFVLLALGALAFLIYQSPLFMVREVKVEGAQRLTCERLTAVAAIPEGSTLLRLDATGIESRLEADPWVESVEVSRSFPSTVLLTVKEREIAAIVEIPSSKTGVPGKNWLISRDGLWLDTFDATALAVESGESGAEDGESEGAGEEADGGTDTDEDVGADAESDASTASATDAANGEEQAVGDAGAGADEQDAGATDATDGMDAEGAAGAAGEPSVLEGVYVTASELGQLSPIRDVPQSLSPKTGEAIADEGVLNALAILNGFTPEMRALVRSISAPDRVKTMITLANNVEVAFGAAEDIAAKEQVITQLLAEHEGTITYINVRVADRATWRATQ